MEDTRRRPGERERSECDPNAARLVLLARSRGILSTCHLRTGLLRGNERARAARSAEPAEKERESRGKSGRREDRGHGKSRGESSDILRDRTILGPLSTGV